MNNLWVFGDSFAYLHDKGDTWQRQLARMLGQTLQAQGLSNTSLSYTFEQFNNVKDNMNSGDTVIIALTESGRRWFLRESPRQSLRSMLTNFPDSGISDAVKYYLTYVNDDLGYEAYLTNFLYHVEYHTKRKNLKTVILPCFEGSSYIANKLDLSLIVAQGNLFAITVNEYSAQFTGREQMQRDIRANHMIHSNHTVLANMLANAITHNLSFTLNPDVFVKHVIDAQTIRSVAFSEKELFDIHLTPEEWDIYNPYRWDIFEPYN